MSTPGFMYVVQVHYHRAGAASLLKLFPDAWQAIDHARTFDQGPDPQLVSEQEHAEGVVWKGELANASVVVRRQAVEGER